MSDSRDGDGGGIGLVKGYGIRIVESADLAVGDGRFADFRFTHFANDSFLSFFVFESKNNTFGFLGLLV